MSTNVDAVRDLRAALHALRPAEKLTLAELARLRLSQPGNAGLMWGMVHLAASEQRTPRELYLALVDAPRSERESVAHLAFLARAHFAAIQAPAYAEFLSALAEAAKAATAAEDETLRAALPDEHRAVLVPEGVDFLDSGDDGPIAA